MVNNRVERGLGQSGSLGSVCESHAGELHPDCLVDQWVNRRDSLSTLVNNVLQFSFLTLGPMKLWISSIHYNRILVEVLLK